MPSTFRINHGPVVFERHDDEVIAINLETGAYFSLTGDSCRAWMLLETGIGAADIAGSFGAADPPGRKAVVDAVDDFLCRLEQDGLVVADASVPSAVPPPVSAPRDAGGVPVFEMKKYSDMQDLLLLDPVHDVGGGGWPEAAAPQAG